MKGSTKRRAVLGSLILLAAVLVFITCVAIYHPLNIPFVGRKPIWSIGIYAGPSPFSLSPSPGLEDPVMTAELVSDVRATSVADPFMVREGGKWYMFFEVMNDETGHGDIGLAVSEDGRRWAYQGIVLDEPFHLSYPYVFKWRGQYYMVPETGEARSVRLYRATEFPFAWRLAAKILEGPYLDPSLFRFGEMWWLFVSDGAERNDTLRLFYSSVLEGPYVEHPQSPIVARNAHIARPAGRVLVFPDHVIRFAQDDEPRYGKRVWAFRITKLTPRLYVEERVGEGPVLQGTGTGWNRSGMHHIDAHEIEKGLWLACVDGYRTTLVFGFGL